MLLIAVESCILALLYNATIRKNTERFSAQLRQFSNIAYFSKANRPIKSAFNNLHYRIRGQRSKKKAKLLWVNSQATFHLTGQTNLFLYLMPACMLTIAALFALTKKSKHCIKMSVFTFTYIKGILFHEQLQLGK